MTTKAGLALAVLMALTSADGRAARPDGFPVPPCAGAPYPASPALGESLNVRVWYPSSGEGRWTPPACTGWSGESYTALVAAAGRFRHAGSSDELLARVGAISRFTTIRYWSVTRGHWRRMIQDAAALDGADPTSRRADFAPDELTPGRVLHYLQEDNDPTRPVVYRLEVRERTPDRVVLALANETPIAIAILDVAEPEGYQFLYVLEREAGEVWRYYNLYRARLALDLLPRDPEASMINRAAAIYRYMVGVPTDLEPPAARERGSSP